MGAQQSSYPQWSRWAEISGQGYAQQASEKQIQPTDQGAQQVRRFTFGLPLAGAQAAPPLTRRERAWWIWQFLKRHDWRMAWMYLRG